MDPQKQPPCKVTLVKGIEDILLSGREGEFVDFNFRSTGGSGLLGEIYRIRRAVVVREQLHLAHAFLKEDLEFLYALQHGVCQLSAFLLQLIVSTEV